MLYRDFPVSISTSVQAYSTGQASPHTPPQRYQFLIALALTLTITAVVNLFITSVVLIVKINRLFFQLHDGDMNLMDFH